MNCNTCNAVLPGPYGTAGVAMSRTKSGVLLCSECGTKEALGDFAAAVTKAKPRRSSVMKHAEFFFDEMTCTMHVVLHRNGDPIHFNVSVNFQKLAETLGRKAEKSRSHVSSVQFDAVKVKHVS